MTDYRNPPPERFFFTGTESSIEPFVRALDASTGQVVWNCPLPKEALFALVLAVGSGRVAVLSGKGHLYVVDQENGQALWSAELPRKNAGHYTKGMVTISARAVQTYLAGYLTGFSLDGQQLWQIDKVDVEAMGTDEGIVHFDRRGN